MTPPHSPERFAFAGALVEIMAPAAAAVGASALLRVTMPSGNRTPRHRHAHEAETVYVLSGVLRAEADGTAMTLRPGQALLLPVRQVHRLANDGDEDAVLLLVSVPGGFEAFVRAAARPLGDDEDIAMTEVDAGRLGQAAPAFGIELLGDPGPVGP